MKYLFREFCCFFFHSKAVFTSWQAPAHRFKHTKIALERAFGMQLEEVFDSIETQPVASGSIGQIHRATLSKKGAAVTGCLQGQIVAVKVRGAGIANQIDGHEHCNVFILVCFKYYA